MNILVWFGAAQSETRVVQQVAERLRARGHRAERGTAVAPEPYDAVVLGARAWRGPAPPSITTYIERHRSALATRPTAFFTVGDSPDPIGRQHATPADQLFQRIGWHPQCVASIASSLSARVCAWFGLSTLAPPTRERAVEQFVDHFDSVLAWRTRTSR